MKMSLQNNSAAIFILALISFGSFPLVRETGPLLGLILIKYIVFKSETESKSLIAVVVDILFWLLFTVFAISDIFLNAMLYLWTNKY